MKENRWIQITAIIISLLVVSFFGFTYLISNQINLNFSAIAEEDNQTTTGTLNYSDGSIYEGDILYGRIKNGTGTYIWNTGEKYSGEWDNDIESGTGKLEWPGLGIYEGEFFNGKREGTGTFTWIYEGEPTEGAPLRYEGGWKDDKINGKGIITFAGIGTYQGDFVNQLRVGVGEFRWLNGDVYSGSWAKDTIEGNGVLTTNDGTVLKGDFAKGVVKKGSIIYAVTNGKVVRSVANGRAQDTVEINYIDGTTVTGKLKADVFIGNVTIKYASGDTYVGTIKNGKKDGKGTYTWKSGAHYIGDWVNDKMSGNGKYFYYKDESSVYLIGTFKNGAPEGTLTYVSERKIKYQTTWSGGQCLNVVYKK